MKWFKVVAVLMLTAMTAGSVANTPSGDDVVSYLDYINMNYQGVNVKPSIEPNSKNAPRSQMWRDLQALENVVRGEGSAAEKSLITIACSRVQCGGKPGPCHTCQAQ